MAQTGENASFVKVFRMMIFLKRKPGMSFEEFQHYWQTYHARAIKAVPIVRKNILRYEQVFPAPSPVDPGNTSWLTASGEDLPDYDGIAILDYASKEAWLEVSKHPDWLAAAPRQNPLFTDASVARRLFCEAHIHVDTVQQDFGEAHPLPDKEDPLLCKAKEEGWWKET